MNRRLVKIFDSITFAYIIIGILVFCITVMSIHIYTLQSNLNQTQYDYSVLKEVSDCQYHKKIIKNLDGEITELEKKLAKYEPTEAGTEKITDGK